VAPPAKGGQPPVTQPSTPPVVHRAAARPPQPPVRRPPVVIDSPQPPAAPTQPSGGFRRSVCRRQQTAGLQSGGQCPDNRGNESPAMSGGRPLVKPKPAPEELDWRDEEGYNGGNKRLEREARTGLTTPAPCGGPNGRARRAYNDQDRYGTSEPPSRPGWMTSRREP